MDQQQDNPKEERAEAIVFSDNLDDFRNSMQPGQKLKIRTLKKPPYWFLVEANEVMAEVMRHDAVWM